MCRILNSYFWKFECWPGVSFRFQSKSFEKGTMWNFCNQFAFCSKFGTNAVVYITSEFGTNALC